MGEVVECSGNLGGLRRLYVGFLGTFVDKDCGYFSSLVHAGLSKCYSYLFLFLLLYYLPKSTSIYIGKQYEIISLIVIRRIFKDLSNLEFSSNWFAIQNDVLFTGDLIAILFKQFDLLISKFKV